LAVTAYNTARPAHVIVWYRGAPYRLDLVRCRRALVERQVAGELDSMATLAKAVGVSRSTASRFFSGRSTSLAVTLKILNVLHLTFEEVATPEHGDDDDGPHAIGARPWPVPSGPESGSAVALRRRAG
jgi:DNA-binding XRE family transcriptional regulator